MLAATGGFQSETRATRPQSAAPRPSLLASDSELWLDVLKRARDLARRLLAPLRSVRSPPSDNDRCYRESRAPAGCALWLSPTPRPARRALVVAGWPRQVWRVLRAHSQRSV